MANKNKTNKRRVAAVKQEERRVSAASRKERRRKLVVGGLVAFLALALIAPLTAGLLGSSGDSDTTTETAPPSTTPVSLPWVTDDRAGAAISGPTPCPAADGTAERTTRFEQAPPICIDPGTTYEMTFDTAAGSFSVPIDSALDTDAANLAVVFGRYHTYEQTPVESIAEVGLLWIGSDGDAGFTIPATAQSGAADELYPVGSVIALADQDSTLAGSLIVVLEESGASMLSLTPRHVVIGTLDDLTEIRAVYEAAAPSVGVLIDSVTVAETG